MRDNDCCAKSPDYGGMVAGRYDERPEPMMGENPCVYRSKAREINIQPMNYGYVVRVGCQTFVFETNEKMIKHLTAYLADPDNIEKSWLNGTLEL